MDNSKNIAICQARPAHGDIEASTAIIIRWMEKAAHAGADIALFGELFLSDYDLNNIPSLSEPKDGPAAKAITEATRRLGIAVIYGYSEVERKECTQYYNSLMFIDSDGKCLANYRKVHIWPETEYRYRPGDVPVVVNWGGVRVGLAICVDVCMSEFVTAMVADAGAQLIVVANALVDAPKYEKSPLMIVPARAIENRCFIAYIDLAGKKYSGMSRLCDPNAEFLVSARTSNEVLLQTNICLDACENVSFRYHLLRRPSAYMIPYETEVPWKKEKQETVQKFFENRAHYYDRQMEGIYNGPRIAAHALSNLVTEKGRRVLDVAAGTGLVGKALFHDGFTNITALDRSEEMLKELASKKVYSQIIYGSFEEKAKGIPDGSFHACICVGAFLTAGFLNPAVCIEEMIRLIEEEGFLLLLVNSTELDEPQCQSTMKSLESVCTKLVKNGLCECIQKSTIPEYLKDCKGIMWIFKKKMGYT